MQYIASIDHSRNYSNQYHYYFNPLQQNFLCKIANFLLSPNKFPNHLSHSYLNHPHQKNHTKFKCLSLSSERNKRKNWNGMQKLYLNGSSPLQKVFNPVFLSSERSGTPEEKRKGTFICIIVLLSYFFMFCLFERMHSNSLKCKRLSYHISVRLKIGDYQFCYMNVLWHVKYCVLILGLAALECISNDDLMTA